MAASAETRSLVPYFTGDRYFTGGTCSTAPFLEKAQAGRNPRAPDRLSPTYLLPARQFPGTLHFPDVSSFVAVSSYQLKESLRRCLTSGSSSSLWAGPCWLLGNRVK